MSHVAWRMAQGTWHGVMNGMERDNNESDEGK
jgi:hypothetical protein